MASQDQAGQDPAETVADGQPWHLAELPTSHVEGLHRQLGVAVPAEEAAPVVAVAMALDIAQPEIEILIQPLQQGRIGAAAEAIAMEEVQEGFAGGRAMPAAQGETGGSRVGPGDQLHRTCLEMTGRSVSAAIPPEQGGRASRAIVDAFEPWISRLDSPSPAHRPADPAAARRAVPGDAPRRPPGRAPGPARRRRTGPRATDALRRHPAHPDRPLPRPARGAGTGPGSARHPRRTCG
ncbi:hypothetical protein D3C76_1150400 [compost metagenome]